MAFSRRFFLSTSVASLVALPLAGRRTYAASEADQGRIAPGVLRCALDALDLHHDQITHRDFLGIIDFSLPSRAARFYVVNLADRSARSHLVAHGRGSDPMHTGWLERFSNEPQSNATSAGAYRTGNSYRGGHGLSMRLDGLDSSNSNASSRALVVHSARYVSAEIADNSGMLGRSQGCFAVAEQSLPKIMTRLGPGRLIYAAKGGLELT